MTDETPAGGTAPTGQAGLSRRRVLVVAGALLPALLTGCKGVQSLGTPPPPPHDVQVLRAAIAAETLMVARYAAAIRQLPASATTGPATLLAAVRTVQTEHAAHLSQLRTRLIEPAGPSPAPAASPTPPAAQASVTSVLTDLEQAEQAASDWLLGQLGGLPPTLAQLCASIAASEATHVPFLRAAG